MKPLLLLLLLATLNCGAQNYPATKKTTGRITRHDITFKDDYTWLENMRAADVNTWVDAQNRLASSHLSDLSAKVFPLTAIKKYDKKTNYRIPIKNGQYYYSRLRKFNEKEQTPVFGYKKTIEAPFIELFNPNFFYSGKTVNVISHHPSKDSKILAYKLMIDGSDRHEIRFVTIASGKKHNDIIKNVKFSNISWKADEGIFYKRSSNASQFAADSTYQICYHKLGTDITADKVVFDNTEAKGQSGFFTSEDGKKLFITLTDRNESKIEHLYADIETENFELKKLSGPTYTYEIDGYKDGKVFFRSKQANWGDVQYYELTNPQVVKTLIPQHQNQLLVRTDFFADRILCKYKNADGNYFMLFDYNGRMIKKIMTQKGMDVDLAGYDYNAGDMFFYVSSYTIPPILFTLNLETGGYERYVSDTYAKTTAPFPLDYFVTKTTTYTSRDGVEVPITIVHKKDLPINGNNPTLLEAYGGFGAISSPHYDNALIYFLNQGGVYAYAEIRGGADKGRMWHSNGKGLKKINTINDFIGAAEYLIAQNYTTANKLGITGGSQGGLLVGAAMVMRPDLFKVAIPNVGVYDMAKFHDYTVGRFHYDEYGDPEVKEEFNAMMAYSPYHNIKEDVNYPTTLIITSDNDDRVPPVHSYKFAARLQGRKAQTNPVYLITRRDRGHYGASATQDEKLQEQSDFYSFLLFHLNR